MRGSMFVKEDKVQMKKTTNLALEAVLIMRMGLRALLKNSKSEIAMAVVRMRRLNMKED